MRPGHVVAERVTWEALRSRGETWAAHQPILGSPTLASLASVSWSVK